jgi:hypothetical protein
LDRHWDPTFLYSTCVRLSYIRCNVIMDEREMRESFMAAHNMPGMPAGMSGGMPGATPGRKPCGCATIQQLGRTVIVRPCRKHTTVLKLLDFSAGRLQALKTAVVQSNDPVAILSAALDDLRLDIDLYKQKKLINNHEAS